MNNPKPSHNPLSTIANPRKPVDGMAVAGKAGRKRLMTVEEALRWAYVFELPKLRQVMAAGPSMATSSSDASYYELLTVIDRNRYGCVPDLSASIAPHLDAVLIGEAVLGLKDVETDEPGDDVIEDVAGLTDLEREECNARGFVLAADRIGDCAMLMMRRAILGGAPTWADHGPVVRGFEVGARGRAVWRRTVMRSAGENRPEIAIEIDGYDHTSHRPYPGAWRRAVLTPDPALLVADRIEYQAFVLMLGLLVEDLTGQLSTIDVTETRLPLWPWEGQEAPRERRVLLARKSPSFAPKGHAVA
ncbi:hypothetical protein Sa4125_25250 [Aureimonas sp. SA4125]|uniref:hypothetical protein n=1 Tax=Aureimonas sp. SA4125 TaxID=2826993 RepID=UPI001CC65FA4|nr:hypothetical protein [Aureimonas sp. SA4125]BDA84983.1 hypothetical protein Sa4125_25250 [Aureimonas sp. SA4125]